MQAYSSNQGNFAEERRYNDRYCKRALFEERILELFGGLAKNDTSDKSAEMS